MMFMLVLLMIQTLSKGYQDPNLSPHLISSNVQMVPGSSQMVRSNVGSPQVLDIQTESKIEYIPFQRKYTQNQQVERIVRVPYETQVVEYEEVQHVTKVPYERIVTDYMAVEKITEYKPQTIKEKVMEYKEVVKKKKHIEYVPVERKFVRELPPEESMRVSRMMQSRVIHTGQSIPVSYLRNSQFGTESRATRRELHVTAF